MLGPFPTAARASGGRLVARSWYLSQGESAGAAPHRHHSVTEGQRNGAGLRPSLDDVTTAM